MSILFYIFFRMGKVIAFSNQKGGSGKSTLSANIAVLWSNSGYKVAVVDADSQKSLTYWLEARKKYYGEDDIGLTQYDFDIKNLIDEVKKIKRKYDYIIIDCSPSLGIVTVNSLVASDSVIIPVQCEYFALEGLGKLLNTIKIVQTRLNNDLAIEGILLTMYDTRLRLSNQVVDEVKTHFQDLVFDTIIQRNTKLGEAPSHGESIIMHDASSRGATNYLNLAREVLQKNNATRMNQEDKIVEFDEENIVNKEEKLNIKNG